MASLPYPRIALWLALPFGALSSWLGLTGEFFLKDLGGATEFFVAVWGASLWADLVFTVGTLTAFALAWRLASRGPWWAALLSGFVLHWFVYWVSFLSLPDRLGGEGAVVETATEATTFVLDWGWVGLVFAATAPVAAVQVVEHRAGKRAGRLATVERV